MNFNILEIVLFVFLTTLFVAVVFRQLKLSVIVGYLLVGTLMGPQGFALIPNTKAIQELAEFGVVFLMFTVGLEFSLPKLISLRYPVFFIGGLQVLFTILITTSLGILLKMTPLEALVVGGIIAMSSTAIVVKQLNDQFELHSRHGLNSLGILLFQDLAVIPLIILIAGFGKNTQASLISMLSQALLKGIFAIFLIFILGRLFLKPLFHLIAKTRAIELFTLTVLLVTLTAAWLTYKLGLSYALGAFLAGIMLSETEYRHQIEVEIRPFRDILLGLFFVTIGMLVDVSHWQETWKPMLLVLSALILGKAVIITLLSLLAKNDRETSVRTGIVLAQGGEFGFAILTLAFTTRLITIEYSQVLLEALIISIAIAPILIYYNKYLARLIVPKKRKHYPISQPNVEPARTLKEHIIICGYGRVGQHIARVLDKINFPYVGLDLDAKRVKEASLSGENIIFGDATHPGILEAVGLKEAKVIVICFNELKSALKTLKIIRHTDREIPVLVRCKDERELKQLKKHGATQTIAEIFEGSLTLSHHLLELIEIPNRKIQNLFREVRSSDYSLLRKVFPSTFQENTGEMVEEQHELLRPILITEDSYAVHKKLSTLALDKIGIEVIAIRRGNIKNLKPRGKVILEPEDIVIVFGTLASLDEAEKILLNGN